MCIVCRVCERRQGRRRKERTLRPFKPAGSAEFAPETLPNVSVELISVKVAGMRRVVITGLGIVAPNGVGKQAFWSACLNGASGVGPIRSFDATGHPVKIAAEVHDFDVAPFIPAGHRKSMKIMS